MNKTAAGEQTLRPGEKYLLTIKEAALYFNIGRDRMRRLAEDNLDQFAILFANRYLIVRPRFEAAILDIIEETKRNAAN